MQIVIDIDENVFTRLFDNGVEDYEIANDDLSAIAKSVRKGTLLPEGHGRLIDADKIRIVRSPYSDDRIEYIIQAINRYINHIPTIIEAERGADDGSNNQYSR